MFCAAIRIIFLTKGWLVVVIVTRVLAGSQNHPHRNLRHFASNEPICLVLIASFKVPFFRKQTTNSEHNFRSHNGNNPIKSPSDSAWYLFPKYNFQLSNPSIGCLRHRHPMECKLKAYITWVISKA